ncbi:MAG TPA: DegV family protein [Firmicutes bacterium]|nr:DegV family protein [Bacillota bacterium]
MPKLHVVTDSGSDLTSRVLRKLAIHVVPLTVQFEEEIFHDGVDISVEQFYERLQSDDVMPSTCQPSPIDFVQVYEKIAEPGDTIISVHLSTKMSGTYQSAVLAGTMVEPDIKVVTVDSKCASIGAGMIAAAAAEAVQKGLGLDEVLDLVGQAVESLHVYFVVDTLEYLQKNGRIGLASALVGTLLNIKPVLTLVDGEVAPFEKIRGKARALKRLHDLAAEMREKHPNRRFRVGLSHSMSPMEAEKLAEALREILPLDGEIMIGPIGPTIGVHTGPGTVAMFAYPVG